MAEDADIVRITSEAWCDHLAELLLTGKKMAKYRLKVQSGEQTLLLREDPKDVAKEYVDRDKDVPAFIVRAILEDLKPQKGGRHTHPEQWAAEKANAISCYLAMNRLRELEPGLSQTAAAERIGKLRCRSGAAVITCWKHFRDAA